MRSLRTSAKVALRSLIGAWVWGSASSCSFDDPGNLVTAGDAVAAGETAVVSAHCRDNVRLMANLEFRFAVHALPDGQALTADELERLILANLEESGGTSQQALWDLACLYSQTGRHAQAIACIRKLTDLVGDAEERASCVLAMGQLHEQIGDYVSSARFYRLALEVATPSSSSWYWIHNNLGYSLNQLGQHEEAERYLRAAIEIDPERANAFKNLALALLAQNLHAQAAEYFVRATQANAADARSLNHLEEVVHQNPELLLDLELRTKLEACRVAVHRATSSQPNFHAHWTELRGKPSN